MLLQGLCGLRAAALHLPRGDHAAEKERPEYEQPEVHPQRRVVPVGGGIGSCFQIHRLGLH